MHIIWGGDNVANAYFSGIIIYKIYNGCFMVVDVTAKGKWFINLLNKSKYVPIET